MTNDDTRAELPPIQLLIAACPITDQPGDRYAWLHGYCLLTIQPGPHNVDVTGEVRIGHRYAENADLVRHLADALDPGAVLAGYDLDDTISRLGRLPIDADQPATALALLAKLKAMIEAHPPLDVGCDEDSKIMVHNQSVAHDLEASENFDLFDETLAVGGVEIRSCHNRGNPKRLAVELADTAGACVLALGECYLPEELGPQLLAAWQRWRRSQTPVFPSGPGMVTGVANEDALH
jgi:hypothetical protein